MKKTEIISVVLFAVASLAYRFQLPVETIESIETKVEITIYIEGKCQQTLQYDFLPTITTVFSELPIENIYGFDDDYVLHDTQILYIPENNNLQELISLSTASTEELMRIPGIGPKTAETLIGYRETTPFNVIEDIMKISGIGEKTYYKIRGYLCL